MIKKLQIFCVILFMSVTKLSATSYDGLFDVKINDWYFSIQWGLDADLDYLTEKTTYYKILSLINNNYELFENLTDSLVFDVSSQSDEINYYLNENEAVTLSFNNEFEFIDCIYKQLLVQYNLKETSSFFYLYSLRVPIEDDDVYKFQAQINFNSFTEIKNGFYIYYFLDLTQMKRINQKKYKMFKQKITIK